MNNAQFLQTVAPQFVPIVDPVSWAVIDIETGDAPEEAIAKAIADWTPPGNVTKSETIQAKRIEAEMKIRDRAALLDQSPILCIVVRTDRGGMILSGMPDQAVTAADWTLYSCGNERDMLLTFRAWADQQCSPGTCIVGHNSIGFDLPKLRCAYSRHRLRCPNILAVSPDGEVLQPVSDTMRLFRQFSMQHRDGYASLADMCASLGVIQPKGEITGADVPRLHREGRYAEILTYCAGDVASTARCWLLMTHLSTELQ